MLPDPQDLGRGSIFFMTIYLPYNSKTIHLPVTAPYNPLLNGTCEKLLSNHTVSHPKFQSYSSETIFLKTHAHAKKVQMQL